MVKSVKQRRILIVEDDLASRLLLTRVLEKSYECFHAGDGADAFRVWLEHCNNSEERFDTIFIDVDLPFINGLDLLTKIRNHEERDSLKKVNAVLATCHQSNEVIQKAKELGCTEYLQKPYNLNQVEALVVKLK